MAQMLSKRVAGGPDRAFRAIDTNQNGYIEASELKAALVNADARKPLPTDQEVKDMLRSVDKDKDGRLNPEEFARLCAREPMTLTGARGTAVDDMSVERLVHREAEAPGVRKLKCERCNISFGSARGPTTSSNSDYSSFLVPRAPQSARPQSLLSNARNFFIGESPSTFEVTSQEHRPLVRDPNPRVWRRNEKTKSSVWQHDQTATPWNTSAREAFRPAPPGREQLDRGEMNKKHRRANWTTGHEATTYQTTTQLYGQGTGSHSRSVDAAKNRTALQQSSLVLGHDHQWNTTNRDDFSLPPLPQTSPRTAQEPGLKRSAIVFGDSPREYKTTVRGAFKTHRFVNGQSMTSEEAAEVAYDSSPRHQRLRPRPF